MPPLSPFSASCAYDGKRIVIPRTGNLWRATSREAFSGDVLTRDMEVDLAITGGGFTGCSAALEAARLGASVCLLEAGRSAHGGSRRNVSLVNAGLWLSPDELSAPLAMNRQPA